MSSSSAATLLGLSYLAVPHGDCISLLSLAMSTLDIRTAESLLNHGAPDSILDLGGRGALEYALDATRLQSTNAADLDSAVKLLVRHGVDINAFRSRSRRQACAVEELVASWERRYTSGQLIDYPEALGSEALSGASIGMTALMYTIYFGNQHRSLAHCVEVLCNNGAKVNVLDKSGTSAFTLAFICLEEGREKFHIERILLDYSD